MTAAEPAPAIAYDHLGDLLNHCLPKFLRRSYYDLEATKAMEIHDKPGVFDVGISLKVRFDTPRDQSLPIYFVQFSQNRFDNAKNLNAKLDYLDGRTMRGVAGLVAFCKREGRTLPFKESYLVNTALNEGRACLTK